MSEETIIQPNPAQIRELLQVLRDQQTFERAKEEAAVMSRGQVGLREARPLHDDDVGDFAQLEATIPAKHYWMIRRKYGAGFFRDDASMRDLRRHHPEYFTKTVSGRIQSGYGSKQQPVRRVRFGRGTLQLAT